MPKRPTTHYQAMMNQDISLFATPTLPTRTWKARRGHSPRAVARVLYGSFSGLPSTSSVVLIEVDWHYPNFRKLLGAHKWSDFVLKPSVYHDNQGGISLPQLPQITAIYEPDLLCTSKDQALHILEFVAVVAEKCPLGLEGVQEPWD
ncbi:hypothetical protein BU17DRAFT_60485 [Hysterangium stoloniferum]|nr:hypothetical protein BU17DRAFT_60485 [Hysterangium stoloniferum]